MSASLGPDSDAGTTVVDPSPSVPAFAIGLLVGAVILGLVWAGPHRWAGRPTRARRRRRTRTSSLLSEPAVAPVVKRTRHDRCVDAVARLKAPLEAAGPAMDQWRVHVGAMNKLVVGEITLQQATDFWDRTRVGAQRRLASFDEAGRRGGAAGPRLPHAGTPRAGVERGPRLRGPGRCRRGDLARGPARPADLGEHVEDMDMLKMGHLSPQDATAMWLASWQQGVREIDAYRGAAKVSRSAPAC